MFSIHPLKHMPNTLMKCDTCGKEFLRVTVQTRTYRNNFCSKACVRTFSQLNHTAPVTTLPCGQCGSPVTRKAKVQRASKSGHLFCNSSCSALYANAHKSVGVRRSKLEVWVEEQLLSRYPNLDLHCNRKDAINAELDFYFPSLKFALEFNGVFHYEPIYGLEKLSRIQANDARKFLTCAEKGIELCVLDTSQQTYFKLKWAKEHLTLVCDILEKVIQQRLGMGWSTQSIPNSTPHNIKDQKS